MAVESVQVVLEELGIVMAGRRGGNVTLEVALKVVNSWS